MTFDRITDWAELSDCQRYTVAASKVLGKFKFQAWRIVPGGIQLLGTEDEAEAARELCRADRGTATNSTADPREKTRADAPEPVAAGRT